jgi:hypothetical protein
MMDMRLAAGRRKVPASPLAKARNRDWCHRGQPAEPSAVTIHVSRAFCPTFVPTFGRHLPRYTARHLPGHSPWAFCPVGSAPSYWSILGKDIYCGYVLSPHLFRGQLNENWVKERTQ